MENYFSKLRRTMECSYRSLQAQWECEVDIMQGDKVEIFGKPSDLSGWYLGWTSIMDCSVGEVGTVTHVDENHNFVSVRTSQGSWNYPFHALKKVDKDVYVAVGDIVISTDGFVGVLIQALPGTFAVVNELTGNRFEDAKTKPTTECSECGLDAPVLTKDDVEDLFFGEYRVGTRIESVWRRGRNPSIGHETMLISYKKVWSDED